MSYRDVKPWHPLWDMSMRRCSWCACEIGPNRWFGICETCSCVFIFQPQVADVVERSRQIQRQHEADWLRALPLSEVKH